MAMPETQREITAAPNRDVEPGYQNLIRYFDGVADVREKWISRNRTYNRELLRAVSQNVPPGSRVLEIGAGTGWLLEELKPSAGVGVDMSPAMVAKASSLRPRLRFVQGFAENVRLGETFDHIVIADTLGFVRDMQAAFENLRPHCTADTRVIVTTYNVFWRPLLNFLERVGLKMRQPESNWLSPVEITNMLTLAGFEVVKKGERLLLPVGIPLLSGLLNRFVCHLPVFYRFALIQYLVARPLGMSTNSAPSVSVIVPARNEAGNIEHILNEIPELGRETEIVFVEGGSQDETWEAIRQSAERHPERKIRYLRQTGKGKGDAVRAGFDAATGDLLMIFDADRTVPASELVKIYHALASNQGEFATGNRLVYPMEQGAMPYFNLLGNMFFKFVLSWLLGQRICDTLCGAKALSRANYRRLAAMNLLGGLDPFGDYDLSGTTT
jgi:SAM-dependent methyltransferase